MSKKTGWLMNMFHPQLPSWATYYPMDVALAEQVQQPECCLGYEENDMHKDFGKWAFTRWSVDETEGSNAMLRITNCLTDIGNGGPYYFAPVCGKRGYDLRLKRKHCMLE